jgi:hypothetical protein
MANLELGFISARFGPGHYQVSESARNRQVLSGYVFEFPYASQVG